MNFDEAVKAHSSWKLKLSSYLRNPDKSLKATEVAMDNKCDLGKWIYGEGSQHSAMPEFATLKSEHTKFHKCAASIITQADGGKSMTEEVMLGSGSEFSVASANVVSAIMKMKLKALR